MPIETAISLQSPNVLLTTTTASGLSFDKGYNVGLVAVVYIGCYLSTGTKVLFKFTDVIRFKYSGTYYYIIDENKIILQIPVV